MSTPTPTPDPWIADGYDLRQKNGRMIAYFGPHHTPADEYPLSCRLQDEANCQWVAAARNELARLRALFPAICSALGNGACCTPDVSIGFLESIPNEVASVVSRLRADLERFTGHGLLDCHAICDQRDAAVAERDQLRAEVERLKATLLSIEKDGTSEHNAAVGLRQNLVAAIARAERFEAERDAFAKDKARLDWLSVSDAWFDYPATGAFTPDTMRAAIDAAMKP